MFKTVPCAPTLQLSYPILSSVLDRVVSGARLHMLPPSTADQKLLVYTHIIYGASHQLGTILER